MLILVTYDVSTAEPAGKRRLARVARKCMANGTRVQNSVFECLLDASQLRRLEHDLEKIIDVQTDSLRFYRLGNNYECSVKHIGAKPSLNLSGPLII
ncbi:CRISPR-associated endoribonuclease Cas2 [Clostridia bacterium]|nr:CRISPR-associated endoribonuclease Cas2 [Clostridia bacterium]